MSIGKGTSVSLSVTVMMEVDASVGALLAIFITSLMLVSVVNGDQLSAESYRSMRWLTVGATTLTVITVVGLAVAYLFMNL